MSKFIAGIMDSAFVIPGTKIRFGVDAIIGLFPGIGDSIGALISAVVITRAAQLGVPKIILARMAGNVLVNTVVGAIPIAGDAFSLFFRSNVRNAELLQRHAGKKSASTARDWLFVILLGLVILAVLVLAVIGSFLAIREVFRFLSGLF